MLRVSRRTIGCRSVDESCGGFRVSLDSAQQLAIQSVVQETERKREQAQHGAVRPEGTVPSAELDRINREAHDRALEILRPDQRRKIEDLAPAPAGPSAPN